MTTMHPAPMARSGKPALDVARHQEPEGNEEVQDHERPTEPLPRAAVVVPALVVPGHFVRNIGVPSQEELGERDVRPEDDPPEEKLAEVVVVLDRHGASEKAAAPQEQRDQDERGDLEERALREELDAEDRRVPGPRPATGASRRRRTSRDTPKSISPMGANRCAAAVFSSALVLSWSVDHRK